MKFETLCLHAGLPHLAWPDLWLLLASELCVRLRLPDDARPTPCRGAGYNLWPSGRLRLQCAACWAELLERMRGPPSAPP